MFLSYLSVVILLFFKFLTINSIQKDAMRKIKNNKEFFEVFVNKNSIIEGSSEASGESGYDDIPEFANCALINIPVEIDQPLTSEIDDGKEFYWPSFVSMPRCVGGCFLKHDSCKASSVEKKNIKVKKVKMVGDKFDIVGVETIEVTHHTECACNCKQLLTDCNQLKHNYNEQKCSCECKTQQTCSATHIWNKNSCSCQCRQVAECPANELFSQNTCKCIRDTSLTSDPTQTSNINLALLCPRKICSGSQVLALSTSPCICKAP